MVAIGRAARDGEPDAAKRRVALDGTSDARVAFKGMGFANGNAKGHGDAREGGEGRQRSCGSGRERQRGEPGARCDRGQVDDRPQIELAALQHPQDTYDGSPISACVTKVRPKDDDAQRRAERRSARHGGVDGLGPPRSRSRQAAPDGRQQSERDRT